MKGLLRLVMLGLVGLVLARLAWQGRGPAPSASRPRLELQPAYAAVTSPTLAFALGPRRIHAAAGDADMPPHDETRDVDDFKRYHLAFPQHPTSTEVGFFERIHVASKKDIKAIVGKLVLRDEHGRALFVQRFHHPLTRIVDRHHALGLHAGSTHWDGSIRVARRDGAPRFKELLDTPEQQLKLEFTPLFVVWADGTMEGDAHAGRAIDGEGLPVWKSATGMAWIVHQQYPNEHPNADLFTVSND